jgi:hypothetical protein
MTAILPGVFLVNRRTMDGIFPLRTRTAEPAARGQSCQRLIVADVPFLTLRRSQAGPAPYPLQKMQRSSHTARLSNAVGFTTATNQPLLHGWW